MRNTVITSTYSESGGESASFTVYSRNRILVLTNGIVISASNGESIGVPAMWDTGSTRSCISRYVIEKLGIEPVGSTRFNTSAGLRVANDYMVDFGLPAGININSWKVSDFDNSAADAESPDFEAIIGMDIISLGEFSVSFKDGLMTYSFRAPALMNADFTGKFLL